MPVRGDIRSVQVPGAVDGWLALHERYGRLPLDDVLAPAIELAAEGFPASIMLALASHLVHALPGAGELCPDGPLDIGQTVRVPGIARTLRAIARRRPRRLLRGRVRAGPARAGRRPLRAGRLRHQRGVVVRPAAGRRLGPRAVDRAAALAGLPDAGRRRRGRGGRARRPTRTIRSGPISSSRPGAPSATTAPRCSSTAPTARRSSTRLGWPPRPPGSGARHGAPRRRRPAAARRAPTWPASATATPRTCARMDADGLGISLTQSNALDFGSHLVEPTTGVFLHNRGVGFSLEPGHPAEVGARAAATAHPLPHARDRTRRRPDPPRRRHGRRRPAADPRPAAGPPAAGRPRSGDAPSPRPASPSTRPRPGPSACGGARTSPCWWRRTRPRPGVRARRPRPSGADDQRLRPRRRRLRPDHRDRAGAGGRPAPGRSVGPPQPVGRRAGSLTARRSPTEPDGARRRENRRPGR